MGAKRKREGCWSQQQLPVDKEDLRKEDELWKEANSSCSQVTNMDGDELTNCSSIGLTNLFKYSSSSIPTRKKGGWREPSLTLVRAIIILIVASSCVVIPVESVCVWQGGGGFKVACGFRQSGLFRLRSLGGVKGYVGAGFTIGDEAGFKDSLSNTEHQNQQQQSGPYVIPNNVHSQRSLPSGPTGQNSQINEHFIPIPGADPNQQNLHYIQNLQDQMEGEHQNLQMQAADQRNQKLLEQQLYLQGGMIPSAPPTPKVKRAGLTKRASLWNWPSIFGRGKGGNNGKNPKKKPKQHDFDGPPNRRGHPHQQKNKQGHNQGHNNRWDRRGKNGPPPGREDRFHDGENRRMPKVPESFIGNMKNPFSHLQDNFVGKRQHSGEMRRINGFNPEQKSFSGRNSQNRHSSRESDRKLPHTLMMPPAGPPIPKFKKFPNGPKQENDDSRMENQHPRPVNRMMSSDDFHSAPESVERRRNGPAGLEMLRRTDNFGKIFHLVNPDGSPVNMNFEKQPIIPPGVPYPTGSQQEGHGSDHSMMAGLPQHHQPVGLGSADMVGGPELDSPLATAVYDPNIFPDIYFTTTEKHNQPESNLLASVGTYALSHELLDNPLLFGLGENQIKRILETSAEKSNFEKKTGIRLKSNEMSNSADGEVVITRKKMRRKKKQRNQDTSEDTTGSDGLAKKKKKGRRKKYKLKVNEIFVSSTERMGLAEGEQASTEAKTESPTPQPLTTASPVMIVNSIPVITATDRLSVKSLDKNGERKTSFTLPSDADEDTKSAILASLEVLRGLGLSDENKVDTSLHLPTTTNRTTSTEETTTRMPMSFSTFGYYDALKNKDVSSFDYDFTGPSGPGEFLRSGYDPRYPPDHEVNRGHNMTKFIRQRMHQSGPSTMAPPSNSPFILHGMTGNRNQSKFSSKFRDADSQQPNRAGDLFGERQNAQPWAQHEPEGHDKGVYLKFDSNEWLHGGHNPNSYQNQKGDQLNKTFNSGYYGANGHRGPSAELPWENKYNPPNAPMHPGNVEDVYGKPKFGTNPPSSSASGSLEHSFFGPTMDMFGIPRPGPAPGASAEKQRNLHKNLFGGASGDVSDLGMWASPNFWGNGQDTDRYSPNSDFETQNNNLKRLLTFGDGNGLKEMKPGDLSSPTPLPIPSPSPSLSGMDEMDDDFMNPSTPGSRWGKQRRRKGRPTTPSPPTTPVPFMSMSSTTSVPSSTPAPKWLAMMSNEVDIPPEYYDNMSLPPHPPNPMEKGKGKKGVEIKFKSGEVSDPEEEGSERPNVTKLEPLPPHTHFDIFGGFPSGSNGFPGGGSVEMSYFPIVNKDSDAHSGHNEQVNVHDPNLFGPSSMSMPPRPPFSGPGSGPPMSGNSRKDFHPSAEDLGPLPPLPPSGPHHGHLQGPGLPSHSDNPFKVFEKQNLPVNSGMGFVSPRHELKAMENQISKFSNVPGEFLRRDSSELKMDHPGFNGPPGMPPSGDMSFAHVEMPHGPPPHMHSAPEEMPPSPLSMYGPSGFPNNLRESDKGHFSGPPSGPEPFPPSMHGEPGNKNGNGPMSAPPGRPSGPNDIPSWEFNPLEHNDVELGPPRHMHPDEHHGPGGRPPPRGPPDSDEGFRHGPPPHFRDGPQRPPPPGHMRNEHDDRRPPPSSRDDYPMRPPHDRPGPPGRHDLPPRGPPGPPGPRDHERRPDFDRDYPPRHHPEERFRDGPGRGPPSNNPPSRPHDRQSNGEIQFFPPGKDNPFRVEHERRMHHEGHKPIENLRPPSAPRQYHDKPPHGEHSTFSTWKDGKEFGRGKFPPPPDQRPPPHSQHPLHKPPYGGKKPPPKIPPQMFKPPPPKSSGGSFFKNMLTGSFGKPNNKRPPMGAPPKSNSNSRPPHSLPPNRRPGPPPEPEHYPKRPYHDDYDPPRHPNNPNNYINSYNDRYEPPPPKSQDSPQFHQHHQQGLPDMAGSKMPFLPFPSGPGSYDSFDFDKNPHGQLLPPPIHPPHQDPSDLSLPVRTLQKQPLPQNPSPVYQTKNPQPPQPVKKMDEKTKVLEAFETLNKADVDVIHSLAVDQYGLNFMDRLKTKSNIMKSDSPAPKLKLIPAGTTTPTPTTFLSNVLKSITTKSPLVQNDQSKLAALLNMINKKPSDSSPSASTMGHSNAELSALFQKLSKPPSSPQPPKQQLAELPSNPGLMSLSSLHQQPSQDIKSLQAQIAKAIISKAQKPEVKPPQQPAPTPDPSPMQVLQQLAQRRMDPATLGKNYTQSQIDTLKKLIALNNIEQKLQNGGIPSPTKSTPTQEDPLKRLQSLLPSALTGQKQSENYLQTHTITHKMLDSSTANSIGHRSHPSNNNVLQDPDPTILALKAIALSKSHGVNPQPSMKFPQQVKPTEASNPIAVDLSAILSPSPPAVEEVSRTRRLINVRNAPKSFYPANATMGFEDPSLPLLSDFHCDEQSFFPGLYSDTELGCRVFHLCAKTEAGFMMKSFRCPKETVFDQEVLRCNWNLFVDCPTSKSKYHFNKYLSQSFQFLKILGEFSANIKKSDATMTG